MQTASWKKLQDAKWLRVFWTVQNNRAIQKTSVRHAQCLQRGEKASKCCKMNRFKDITSRHKGTQRVCSCGVQVHARSKVMQTGSQPFFFFLSPLWGMGCGWWIVFSGRRIALTNCVLMILFTDHHPAQEGKSGGGYELWPSAALPQCCLGIRELLMKEPGRRNWGQQTKKTS